MSTPREDGFAMPAEWAPHQACLMEWPTQTRAQLWGELLDEAKRDYATVARAIAAFEPVIMVADPAQAGEAHDHCGSGIEILPVPIDDSWMRDNGPIFVADPRGRLALVHFRFNSWGERYLPYDRDALVPAAIAAHLGVRRYAAPFVLEGGSIFVDGEGTLLTTEQCLLNPNRNPQLGKRDIERYLYDYYGIDHILWLGDGIVGDDTDGHIDDLTRFVSEDTVVTVVEANKSDDNYRPLQENLRLLKQMRLENGKQLQVVELPMPSPVVYEGQRLPASYANFYIANDHVVVPTYRDKNDDKALDVLQQCFPERQVIGLDSRDIIWGLGSFHCLSQQEPEVPA